MNWFRGVLFGALIVFGLTSAGGILIFVTSDGLYEPPRQEAFIERDFFSPIKGMNISKGAKFSPSSRTVMFFVGDIMLGRYVETLMGVNGSQYPFKKIEPFLAHEGFCFRKSRRTGCLQSFSNAEFLYELFFLGR